MGYPTAAEGSQLKRLSHIASLLRDREATDSDRDEAQAIMLEVYVEERKLGFVAGLECKNHRKKIMDEFAKSVGWNTKKSAACVMSSLLACLTVLRLATMLID